MTTLVLGLGNVLLGDEGAGVWVAEALRRRWRLPEGAAVLDGGTLGLDLLPRLAGVERLLLVDAVRAGGAPGTLVRLEGDDVPAALAPKISPHQVGLQDLLAVARLTGVEPPHLVLLGVEPGRLEPGTAFSAPVAAALPALEARVIEELRAWGVAVERRAADAPAAWWEARRQGVPP